MELGSRTSFLLHKTDNMVTSTYQVDEKEAGDANSLKNIATEGGRMQSKSAVNLIDNSLPYNIAMSLCQPNGLKESKERMETFPIPRSSILNRAANFLEVLKAENMKLNSSTNPIKLDDILVEVNDSDDGSNEMISFVDGNQNNHDRKDDDKSVNGPYIEMDLGLGVFDTKMDEERMSKISELNNIQINSINSENEDNDLELNENKLKNELIETNVGFINAQQLLICDENKESSTQPLDSSPTRKRNPDEMMEATDIDSPKKKRIWLLD